MNTTSFYRFDLPKIREERNLSDLNEFVVSVYYIKLYIIKDLKFISIRLRFL